MANETASLHDINRLTPEIDTCPAGTASLAASSESVQGASGTPCNLNCSKMPTKLPEDCNDHDLDSISTTGTAEKLSSLSKRQQNQWRSGSLHCHQDDSKENDPKNIRTCPIAFTVSVGDVSQQKPPPKKLCSQTNRRQQPAVSARSIQEKLERADARRKQQEEARLKRIHSRQEAARKLAHNVEILLQQRALASGDLTDGEAKKRMSSRELLATAQQVASNFNTLTHQMKSDLAVDSKSTRTHLTPNPPDHHKQCIGKSSSDRNQNVSSTTTSAHAASLGLAKGGIAFTVAFQESTKVMENFASPKMESPAKPKGSKTNQTVEDIEEKLRKAEERRNTRIQHRVKRAVANRENMFEFAAKLDTFLTLQDSDSASSRREAAKLADEIADTFERMSQNCERVLKRAENFPCQTLFMSSSNTEKH